MTIFVFSNNSFAQDNTVDIDKLCLGKTCTKPIKEFQISNFFFKMPGTIPSLSLSLSQSRNLTQ